MTNGKIDFLGIGAPRAATTWLCANLRRHPAIWMPPKKELHYFDRSPKYPSPSHLASKYLARRLFRRDFRKRLVKDFTKAIRNKQWQKIHWLLGYYLGTYGDDWYLSLFRKGDGKIKGEITPSYSILDVSDVQQVATLFPSLKIILMLRNPIDRAWSQVRLNLRNRSLDNVDKIKKFIDSPTLSLRSDYMRTINHWSSCFPREQLFIGFHDDIVINPRLFVCHVLKFLGVASETTGPEVLEHKINPAQEKKIPEEIRYYLASKHYPALQELVRLVGGHSERWLVETEEILKTRRSKPISPPQEQSTGG